MHAKPRRGRVRGAAVCLMAWSAACRPEPTTPPEPDPTAAEPAEPRPDARPSACEPGGAPFDDHSWAPAATPALASIALDDPALTDALRTLGEHARGPGHGLPIPLAFSLSQWSWQVPALVATLDQAGFSPTELVFVADDEGADHAWVWHSACDLEGALQAMEAAWGVRSRTVVDGVIASPEPPADPDGVAFPYDVLVLPGDRFALVPAGRAASVRQRWDRPAPATALGSRAPGPGDRLDQLEPAPVRLVVRGHALVDASATSTPDGIRALRILADRIETPAGADASLGAGP